MNDTYQRRNRIAALTGSYYRDTAEAALQHATAQGRPCLIDVRVVMASYRSIFAALAGETDPHALGVDPLSMPALQIASLTSDASEEP